MAIKVKICGLKTEAALAAALTAGADYVGFVFYPPSPRYVAPATAAKLARQVALPARKVAVCVDADDRALDDITAALEPDFFQLHGAESILRVTEVQRRYGRPVIKAVAIAGEADVARAHAYEEVADMLLLDAKPPADGAESLPGGNGLAFDWRLIAGERWGRPWLLSGGLSTANVREAIAEARAPGVDVSSGVERRPGDKDPDLIRQFLSAAKSSACG